MNYFNYIARYFNKKTPFGNCAGHNVAVAHKQ